MQEQEQNRTEKATPFKLNEAKKKGQVAKSMDFNTLVVLGGLLAAIAIWGASQWHGLCDLCARIFVSAGAINFEEGVPPQLMSSISREALMFVGPIAGAAVIFAIIANVLQTGFIFTTHPLKPQFERLNPVAGFKRVFNKRMLFEALKSLLKLVFFATIGYLFFSALWPTLPMASLQDVEQQTDWLGSNVLALLFRLGLAVAVVGMLDLFLSRWLFAKQMMMSTREVKEEIKRREGDPLIRSKIRELQRENLKQARSMSRLPEADVLITNPTHFAVALRYVRGEMDAPRVIAKGSDKWAAEMRTIARQHGVPIFERRALARELFRYSRIDSPIPMESFVEVARVYAELARQPAVRSRYEVHQ